MTDPWRNVRKLLQERGGIYDITVSELLDLLRDADALLAVKEAVEGLRIVPWLIDPHQRVVGFGEAYEPVDDLFSKAARLADALAALSEHLK